MHNYFIKRPTKCRKREIVGFHKNYFALKEGAYNTIPIPAPGDDSVKNLSSEIEIYFVAHRKCFFLGISNKAWPSLSAIEITRCVVNLTY